MGITRRAVLSAIGCLTPPALAGVGGGGTFAAAPLLRLRSFEEAVRAAFAGVAPAPPGDDPICRRTEVGHSELFARGVQGCHNDRPFAGHPAGRLRIVRAGTEPGPLVGGVRLYVCTVEVVLTSDQNWGSESRPLDFALLPPAPVLVPQGPDFDSSLSRLSVDRLFGRS